MNDSGKRSFVRPLVRTAVSTLLFMAAFETLKQALYPAVTVWRSHLITIIFTTVVSVVVTHVALQRYRSARNEMESEILRLNSDLKLVNQELEAFNHTVAHDLRQPLNVLGGYCQLIEQLYGESLELECKEYVREAYNCTLRMNRLIDALLKFSRMSQVVPQREMVDLGVVAQEVVRMLKMAEPRRQVEVTVAEGMLVNAEPELLRMVLENLIGNAWKYTSMRERSVIEVGVRDMGGERVFFVRDNGLGFSKDDAAKLFTPFLRLPEAEKYRGYGVGLATVERIIRRHGGRIWGEGETGKGAVIYFTLPPAA